VVTTEIFPNLNVERVASLDRLYHMRSLEVPDARLQIADPRRPDDAKRPFPLTRLDFFPIGSIGGSVAGIGSACLQPARVRALLSARLRIVRGRQ